MRQYSVGYSIMTVVIIVIPTSGADQRVFGRTPIHRDTSTDTNKN